MENLVVKPEFYQRPFFDLFLKRLEDTDIDLAWISINLPDVYEAIEELQRKVLRGTESRRLSEVMSDVGAWWDAFQFGLDLQHGLKIFGPGLSKE